jgi:branched-chain amino acid transport system permease protein
MAVFGCVVALRTAFVSPDVSFSAFVSLYSLITILVGGVGTTIGPILGTIVCEFASYFLFINIQFALYAIWGVIIILVKLLLPQGIWPLLREKIIRSKV